MTKVINALPTVSAVFGTALMLLLLAILLVRYFASLFFPDSKAARLLHRGIKPHTKRGSWKGAFLNALIWFVISRLLVFLVCLVYAYSSGASGYLSNMYSWWAKWDAPHYIGLIKNWYVNEGDPRFHIVFFPMYPLVCRLLLPIFGGNADISAMAVSNLCGLFAGTLLYQLSAMDHGERAAERTVRFFFLNPLSFFLSLPYTESMFLLLTVAAVYLARRRRYVPALVIGAMCAACRLMGVVVAIPIFYSMLDDDRRSGRLCAKRAAMRFFSCCAVLLGVAGYLLLNWQVTGNPFQFWIYQKEHWHNTTGSLWNTFSYIVHYALYGDAPMQFATWVPTILLIYGAIALLYLYSRRANAGDAAYGWAYLYMTIVPTWLISGPRYVSGLYALYPMLGHISGKKWIDVGLTCASAIGLCCMACLFVFTSGVY